MPRNRSTPECHRPETAAHVEAPAFAGPTAADAQRLQEAVGGLLSRSPELSAAGGLWRWQRRALTVLLVVVCLAALLAPEGALVAVLAIMAIPFLCVVMLRSVALWHLFARTATRAQSMAAASLAGETVFPCYTVLVPLFREAGVIPQLLTALRAIDYPADRLEVMLIVESVDGETQATLQRVELDAHIRVLIVPDGAPRTKPRALQFALQYAQGDYVVVYDAEDMPEPDQLLRALAAIRAGPGRLGCLQGQLNIYNSNASWLTRQFTVEYTALFDGILPALERLQLPVPLGGTSNHFPGLLAQEHQVLGRRRSWI